MHVVNGFDIDTPEGAEEYLKSKGVDVEQFLSRGIDQLKKNKARHLYRVSGDCDHPNERRVDWHDDSVLCEQCNCIIEQNGVKIDPPCLL